MYIGVGNSGSGVKFALTEMANKTSTKKRLIKPVSNSDDVFFFMSTRLRASISCFIPRFFAVKAFL
jgi:hypothetical protein